MPDNKTVTFDAETQQIVPKVPTEAMRDAGNVYVRNRSVLFHAWKDMLAAAPTPAAQSEGQEAVPVGCVQVGDGSITFIPDADAWRMGDEYEVFANAAPVNGGERDIEAARTEAYRKGVADGRLEAEQRLRSGRECPGCEGKPAPQNNPCAVCGKRAADAQQVGDLCMLVKRLAQALRKTSPDNDLAKNALDYLKRIDAQGSLLRDCEKCGGDCSSANPPVIFCPLQDRAASDEARRTAEHWKAAHLAGNAEIERLKKLLYAKVGGDKRDTVAYLDIGAGGYIDLGTDLTDEQLAALPKGRHMLGIIGTYGVDGYHCTLPSMYDGKDAERLQFAMRKWGPHEFAMHVLRRGGDGDLSDCRSFVDAAIAANQAKGDV